MVQPDSLRGQRWPKEVSIKDMVSQQPMLDVSTDGGWKMLRLCQVTVSWVSGWVSQKVAQTSFQTVQSKQTFSWPMTELQWVNILQVVEKIIEMIRMSRFEFFEGMKCKDSAEENTCYLSRSLSLRLYLFLIFSLLFSSLSLHLAFANC